MITDLDHGEQMEFLRDVQHKSIFELYVQIRNRELFALNRWTSLFTHTLFQHLYTTSLPPAVGEICPSLYTLGLDVLMPLLHNLCIHIVSSELAGNTQMAKQSNGATYISYFGAL